MRLLIKRLHPRVHGILRLFPLLRARHFALLHDFRPAHVAAEVEPACGGGQGDEGGDVELVELFFAAGTEVVVLVDFLRLALGDECMS